jgi:hypothetical protein
LIFSATHALDTTWKKTVLSCVIAQQGARAC